MPAPVLTPKVVKDLADFFFEGFNDDDAAFYFNLPQPLIQAIRSGAVYGNVRRGVISRKRYYVNKLLKGKKLSGGIVWFLERRFPHEFSKPETQLGLVNGPSVNNTLVVSAELAERLVARSKPLEDELTKLLKERDQRSVLTDPKIAGMETGIAEEASTSLTTSELAEFASDDASADASEARINTSDDLVDVQANPSLARYVSKRAIASLDGHLPAPGMVEGDASPVPPAVAASPPIPLSGKNPRIQDSEGKKRGRPKKSKDIS